LSSSSQEREDLAEQRDALILAGEEDLLELRGHLHGHDLVPEVGERADVALGHNGHNLAQLHVGPRPAVEVLAAVHAEAAGDAVDRPVGKKLVLAVPLDLEEVGAVPDSVERPGEDVDVDAGVLAALVQVAERGIVVAADGERRAAFSRVGVTLRRRRAPGEQRRAHAEQNALLESSKSPSPSHSRITLPGPHSVTVIACSFWCHPSFVATHQPMTVTQ